MTHGGKYEGKKDLIVVYTHTFTIGFVNKERRMREREREKIIIGMVEGCNG